MVAPHPETDKKRDHREKHTEPLEENRDEAGEPPEAFVGNAFPHLRRRITIVEHGPGEEQPEAEEESAHDDTEGNTSLVRHLLGPIHELTRRPKKPGDEARERVPCQDLDHEACWKTANGSDPLKIRCPERGTFATSYGTVKVQLCLGKPGIFPGK